MIHWPQLEEALGIETTLHGVPGHQPSAAELAPRAARLKSIRAKAGLTQVELAQRPGCSQALIRMAEKGKAWVGLDWEQRVEAACSSEVVARLVMAQGE